LLAVLGVEAIATLIAVYGLFMTPLGWGWAGLVWGYALVWFLISDRVKLLAYRILDPVKDNGAVSADTATTKDGSPADLPPELAFPAKVAPFYTDTDPEEPVYHDNSDCPYGQEIKRHGNDSPGTDGRRRCDWCAQHDRSSSPASL
jgi:H+-transporting ATPase